MLAQRVRVDQEQVIHETVDGEVILIALQTGCYYSLEGSGADVWTGILAGRSAAEIAAELEERHVAAPGEIEAAVSELVGRLVEEQLVLAAEPDAGRAPELHAVAAAERTPFPPPVLHKFTDMQDFLLVDPIHEVSDEGWPHAPTAARGGAM